MILIIISNNPVVNTLKPRQDLCHLPDDIFKLVFFCENSCILIKFLLNQFPMVQLTFSIGLDNGMVLSRWQALTWNNGGLVHWYVYLMCYLASLDGNTPIACQKNVIFLVIIIINMAYTGITCIWNSLKKVIWPRCPKITLFLLETCFVLPTIMPARCLSQYKYMEICYENIALKEAVKEKYSCLFINCMFKLSYYFSILIHDL